MGVELTENINSEWISDKTRFAFDGLKRQRLTYPLIKFKNSFKIISWKIVLLYLKNIFNNIKGDEIKGYIGKLIDNETSLIFKDFFNHLGSSNLSLENSSTDLINSDFRFNYLFNTIINHKNYISNSLNKSDIVLLIGVNPRLEGSAVNIKLRQLVVKKQLPIYSIGPSSNLTYKVESLGNNLISLIKILEGRHFLSQRLKKAMNPTLILGTLILNNNFNVINLLTQVNKYLLNIISLRENFNDLIIKKYFNTLKFGPILNKTNSLSINLTYTKRTLNIPKLNLISIILNFKQKQNLIINTSYWLFFLKLVLTRISWNGLNILHNSSNQVGHYDLGIALDRNKYNSKKKLKVLYLLGNELDSSTINLTENPFIIYQGHTGTTTLNNVNLILPSTPFTEKRGLYVNTEGMVQETQIANISPFGDIKDDWQIIRVISDLFNLPLSNTIGEIRNRLYYLSPTFHYTYHYRDLLFAKESLIKFGTHNSTILVKNYNNYNYKFINKINLNILISVINNYYMTDIISKSSQTMALCTSKLKHSLFKNTIEV